MLRTLSERIIVVAACLLNRECCPNASHVGVDAIQCAVQAVKLTFPHPRRRKGESIRMQMLNTACQMALHNTNLPIPVLLDRHCISMQLHSMQSQPAMVPIQEQLLLMLLHLQVGHMVLQKHDCYSDCYVLRNMPCLQPTTSHL